MPRPKQHHFVTKAYLDGFLLPDEKQLVCYGRNGKSFRKSPDELGKRRNYYSVKNADGSWDDSLEELIERTIEVPGIRVVKKLCSGKTRLTWDERRALSLLIAFQERRTPAAREQARTMSRLFNECIVPQVEGSDSKDRSIKLHGDHGQFSDVTIADMIASHQTLCDDYAIEMHRMMARSAFDLHQIYQQMKFTVLYPMKDARFITTDTPVIRVYYGKQGEGAGLDRNDVEIRFPLSSKALLSITHDPPRIKAAERAKGKKLEKVFASLPEIRILYISNDEVLAMNRGQVRHAQHWAFSSEELPWVEQILLSPPTAPQVVDLSSRNVLHFQTKVSYDPRIDIGPY